MIKILSSFVFAIFIFTGCANNNYSSIGGKTYTNPIGEEKMNCVYKCDFRKESCNRLNANQYDLAIDKYEEKLKVYEKCLEQNSPSSIRERKEIMCNDFILKCTEYSSYRTCLSQCDTVVKVEPIKCSKPSKPTMKETCLKDWEQCFRNCGGLVSDY